MIEKDKAYTYDELKDIVIKATADAVTKLSKSFDDDKVNDTAFTTLTSMIYLMAYADLNRILFYKNVKEEKEN